MKKKSSAKEAEESKQEIEIAGEDLIDISGINQDPDCEVEMGEATESHYSILVGQNTEDIDGFSRERSKSPATAPARSSHLVEGRM